MMALRRSASSSESSALNSDKSFARALVEEPLGSETREGVISLGGVGDFSLGEGISAVSAEFRRRLRCLSLARRRSACSSTIFTGSL